MGRVFDDSAVRAEIFHDSAMRAEIMSRWYGKLRCGASLSFGHWLPFERTVWQRKFAREPPRHNNDH